MAENKNGWPDGLLSAQESAVRAEKEAIFAVMEACPDLTHGAVRKMSIMQRCDAILGRDVGSQKICQLGTRGLGELGDEGTRKLGKLPSSNPSSLTTFSDGGLGAQPPTSGTKLSSNPSGFEDEYPDLYQLLDSYESGKLVPVPVRLGSLPRMAPDIERRVAEDIALCLGLRRAVGDPRPLIYSRSFLCRRMGWEVAQKKSAADRIIQRLLRWGVIERGPDLIGQQGKRPSWTYRPPDNIEDS